MHRSGTSALNGVLNIMGLNLGTRMVATTYDNVKGFFENFFVHDVNERIFKSLNSSYDSLYLLPNNWWRSKDLKIYKDEIKKLIKDEFNISNLIGIKDPRMCRLLPLWNEVFKELKFKLCFVIIIRNPLEIAQSLLVRNGFSIQKSMILWLLHMLEAELYSRNFLRIFILFNDLLSNTEKTINLILNVLGIELPKQFRDVKDEIKQFLEKDLKHHNIETKKLNKCVLPIITDYYHLLLSLNNKKEIEKDNLFKIDEIRKKFIKYNSFFYNADIVKKDESINKLEYEISIKNEKLTNLINENQKLNTQLINVHESYFWKLALLCYKIYNKIPFIKYLIRLLIKYPIKFIIICKKEGFINILSKIRQ